MAMSGKSISKNDRIPSGYRAGQLQQFTPEQMELFQRSQENVGPDSYLSRLAGGDEDLMNEMEAPALRQFSGLQGNMASRFSGGGDLGSRRSSGFQNEMTAAGSNFAQELQSRRQGLQQQAIKDLHGMSMELLNQRPYDRFVSEKRRKQGNGWGGVVGAGVGAVGGGLLGGPAGAFAGAQAGYGIGSGQGFGKGGITGGGLSNSWGGLGGGGGMDQLNDYSNSVNSASYY